ncbi:MAG: MerR family transcriptional regulator [Desulfuromonadales bacterium]|nr:MerR family transcriptional regulator [Desulfuromonadales bacterium]
MADIPDKLFFKIGEVADLLDLKTHVLRYWETEFTCLKPVKSRSNQRLYRRQDVETALLIKDLLYQRGFTIAGARNQLDHKKTLDLSVSSREDSSLTAQQRLVQIKTDLLVLRQSLLDNQ